MRAETGYCLCLNETVVGRWLSLTTSVETDSGPSLKTLPLVYPPALCAALHGVCTTLLLEKTPSDFHLQVWGWRSSGLCILIIKVDEGG